jgi:hypothetical protein
MASVPVSRSFEPVLRQALQSERPHSQGAKETTERDAHPRNGEVSVPTLPSIPQVRTTYPARKHMPRCRYRRSSSATRARGIRKINSVHFKHHTPNYLQGNRLRAQAPNVRCSLATVARSPKTVSPKTASRILRRARGIEQPPSMARRLLAKRQAACVLVRFVRIGGRK